jgi:hypothetical protein
MRTQYSCVGYYNDSSTRVSVLGALRNDPWASRAGHNIPQIPCFCRQQFGLGPGSRFETGRIKCRLHHPSSGFTRYLQDMDDQCSNSGLGRTSLLAAMSTAALQATQSSIRWAPGALTTEVKRPENRLTLGFMKCKDLEHLDIYLHASTSIHSLMPLVWRVKIKA